MGPKVQGWMAPISDLLKPNPNHYEKCSAHPYFHYCILQRTESLQILSLPWHFQSKIIPYMCLYALGDFDHSLHVFQNPWSKFCLFISLLRVQLLDYVAIAIISKYLWPKTTQFFVPGSSLDNCGLRGPDSSYCLKLWWSPGREQENGKSLRFVCRHIGGSEVNCDAFVEFFFFY